MFCIQAKRTKRSKPSTQHSQQPTSSLHDQKQDVATKTPVHKTTSYPPASSELTESSEPSKVSLWIQQLYVINFVVIMLFQIQTVHADDGESCTQEHGESVYQTVKIKPVPLPRLSSKTLDPLIPPKTVSLYLWCTYMTVVFIHHRECGRGLLSQYQIVLSHRPHHLLKMRSSLVILQWMKQFSHLQLVVVL